MSFFRKIFIRDGAGNDREANVTASNELNVLDSNSAAIKTAAEKIDDLQGALKSQDLDELITRVTDSSGAEINPAKEDGNLNSVKTSVEIMDDWDESDRAKVNPIAGQAGVAGGTGADAATVQRVSLATDIPLPAGTNVIGKTTISAGGNDVDVTSVEGDKSLRVTPGMMDSFTVHLGAINIAAEQAFMLVDLSDTTNWPHTNTGHVNVQGIVISIDPATAFRGDVTIGFLSDVDATNGDMNVIVGWHFTQGSAFVNLSIIAPFLHFEGEATNWFGLTKADNTNFQTDVNLDGPDGATSYPSGAGDIVLLIERTAGNVDVGITIMYRTIS